MRIKVQEFIDAKNPGDLIGGDNPGGLSQVTSKSTTDQHVAATRQAVSLQNYRRYATEAVLPFAEQADLMQEEPGKFYEFLREQGQEETFEAYFVEATVPDVQSEIKQIAKENILKVAEQFIDIAKKRQSSDVIKREPVSTVTIEEIRNNDRLIVEKLEKLASYCRTNMDEAACKSNLNTF